MGAAVPNMPIGLDIESLPGPRRGVSPAIYFHDEIIASPSCRSFVLAYTIYEATFGSNVGQIAWGRIVAGRAKIVATPKLAVCCWSQPWAVWLDDETFVFKAGRRDGKRTHVPLVVINLESGFAVIPGTDHDASRPTGVDSPPAKFKPFSDAALVRDIAGDAEPDGIGPRSWIRWLLRGPRRAP